MKEKPAASPEVKDAEAGGRAFSERQQRRNLETRKKLMEAAAKIVAEHGYAGASIARITAEAGVAHGAFYLHFPSRQDLFDKLLPAIGQDMIEQIGKATRQARSLADVEAQGVSANFRYLVEHHALFRVMTEAEYFAPDTYQEFISVLLERYANSLGRSRERGEIRGYDAEEMEVLATILMGARDFLLQRYVKSDDADKHKTKAATRTYLRFVLAGLTYADQVDVSALLPPDEES